MRSIGSALRDWPATLTPEKIDKAFEVPRRNALSPPISTSFTREGGEWVIAFHRLAGPDFFLNALRNEDAHFTGTSIINALLAEAKRAIDVTSPS